MRSGKQSSLDGSRPTSSPSPNPPGSAVAWPCERVLGESPRQRLLAADLLAAYKTLYRDGDGPVDILRATELLQPHAAEGLGDADDGLQVADLFGEEVSTSCMR